MLLLNGESLSKAFSTKQLFEGLCLSIFEGDQIGLIGENGSGKTTLLKIIAGLEKADSGNLSARRGLKIGYLPQTCEFPDLSIEEILGDSLEAKKWLSKLGFTGKEPSAANLSGGWKKRLALAKEMLSEPDLLLLDEPTNHLDLEGIVFLEKFLKREAPTYLLVSHDRYFLQNATNRIIEISPAYPQGLFAIDGSYANFLEKKEQFLQGQLEQERSLASKARRETEWLRSNPKARTSKSRSRIDQAHELLKDLSDVQKRNTKKKASIDFIGSERETRKLLVAKNIRKQLGDKVLFQGLEFLLSPGSRIGLMGPNGCGKTTLLRILADEIQVDQGTIKRADALKTVYFDQHRNQLPDTMTLKDALSPTGDFVHFQGQPIHINGWCKRFLFSPDSLTLPLSTFSGGERARIAIAHLMLQPADLLLLDEPTNDLDIPTLETLEESLMEFPGAVVLITHDRCMIDRICNSFITLGQKPEEKLEPTKEQEKPVLIKSKLSYNEKKEYEQIESKIAKLEEEIKQLTQFLVNNNPDDLDKICTAISLAETQVEQLYLRWSELDQKQNRPFA